MRPLASILIPVLPLAGCGGSSAGNAASNYTVDRSHAKTVTAISVRPRSKPLNIGVSLS